ncbi:MAG: flagellar filament capping protein FliD [Schwartzia sp.]|nr:flagellar filament capping protein FliD [Schwartzia sp. (in: firmicutes)]
MGVNGIYGLSGSGLDIESMVKAGMLSMQSNYDKMYKKETKQAWEKEIYADLYSSLNTFKYTTLSSYKMKSTLNAMSANTSDDKTVTATANGDAVAMSHTVKVNSLGSNAYLLTDESGIKRANTNSDSSMKLADSVFYSLEATEDGKYKYKLSADDTEHIVDGDDIAISFTLNDSTTALSDEEKLSNTISYTFAELAGGKSFNDLASNINKLGTSVTASYDATTDTFTMYNSEGGADNTISLTMAAATENPEEGNRGDVYDFASTLFNNLNLKSSANGELSAISAFAAGTENVTAGTDAEAVIDGKTYKNMQNNKLTVSGVTYNLIGINKNDENPARITVTQDTDKIIETVKKFVDDYNAVLDDLNTKYRTSTWNSDSHSDYEPLTKSEQADMTDEQIEKWNDKVKAGLLYHSNILQKLISNMRTAISTPVLSVDSSYNSASAIGITSSDTKGHLTLDEDKLKKALAADPDCVYQIFASDQDTYTDADVNKRQSYMKTDDYNNRGIINRLYYDAVTEGISQIKEYAGIDSDTDDQSTLGKAITSLLNKMTDYEDKMSSYQSMLYSKYDALENYVSQMNSVYSTIFGAGSQ